MLGNFSCFFLSSADFFKKFFHEYSHSLDPDHYVGPDLCTNCLQRLSADDKVISSEISILLHNLSHQQKVNTEINLFISSHSRYLHDFFCGLLIFSKSTFLMISLSSVVFFCFFQNQLFLKFLSGIPLGC